MRHPRVEAHLSVVGVLGGHRRGRLGGELIELGGGDALVDANRDLLRDENLRGVWDGETWAHVSASAFGKRGACTRGR